MAEPDNARITTGISSLDHILDGGLPKGSIVFVTGLPGSGKTILSEQAFFANAALARPSLYLTTLSEPPAKLLRYARDFDYFDANLIERTAYFGDLGVALRSTGAGGMLTRLDEYIKEIRPEFLVIDSFKVVREHFDDQKSFRAFVSDVMILLTAWEVTSLLVGEYPFEDIASQAEFAIADGIIHLSGTEEPQRQKRYMNVIKMRGANAFLGHHSYEVGPDGITVYPRLMPHVSGDYPTTDGNIGSAVVGMSSLLTEGIPPGAVVLLEGAAGTGKTLVALGFVIDRLEEEEPCVFMTFEESPAQIVRNCRDLGWDLTPHVESGRLTFIHVSPSELDIDRHAILLKDRAHELSACMVVIDSITALATSTSDRERVRAYLWGMADYFKRQRITLILTSEDTDTLSPLNQSISYVADAVIKLNVTRVAEDARRQVHVVKVRGREHALGSQELRIDRAGVRVVENGANAAK